MQIHVPPQLNIGNLNHSRLVNTSDRFDSRQCVTLKASSDVHTSRIAGAVADIAGQASDICLVASSGQAIPTNRLLLALASPFLAHLIGDVPCCAKPVLVLPDINSEILTHIVRIITDGFTTNYFGNSLSHIFKEIDEIMNTAKTLDIAIVDLNYGDGNSVNAYQNYGDEYKESLENEIRMEDDTSETIDSEFHVEYEFVKEFEDNAIDLDTVKFKALGSDGIGSFENDGTFINECNILESVTETLTMLRDKNEEIEEKCYFCNNCPLSFSNVDDWEVHVKIHKEERQFKCSNCPLRFNDEQRKENHVRKHEIGFEVDAKIFTCDVCDKMFYKKRLLRNHIMAHTDVREHKCPFCPADFFSYDCKRSHIRKKHAIDEGFIVKCKICQKTFYDKEILEKHYAKHDNTELSL